MAVSVISICNAALRLVNAGRIDALNESSEQARACSAVFETARDSVLREYVWSFARTFAPLAEVSGASVPSWAYVYKVPSDCIRAVSVLPGEDSDAALFIASPERPFERYDACFELAHLNNEAVLLTNLDCAVLEYVKQVTDPTLYDSLFVEALEYKLASLLAVPLTGDAKNAQYYAQAALNAIAHARGVDAGIGQSRPIVRPCVSRFERARR